MRSIRGVVGRGEGDVESPHILDDSFRANKNRCRVSLGKDGQCGGGEEAITRGLKKGGWRWRGESEIRKHQGQTRRGQGKEGGESAGVRRIER